MIQTGLKIKRGIQEGRELLLVDIIKGSQTYNIVVKQRTNDGKFVDKFLNARTNYDRVYEQDLQEFLDVWNNIEVIGNINICRNNKKC